MEVFAEQMLLPWTMKIPPSSDDHSISGHFITQGRYEDR
jgi:hypothetical protein